MSINIYYQLYIHFQDWRKNIGWIILLFHWRIRWLLIQWAVFTLYIRKIQIVWKVMFFSPPPSGDMIFVKITKEWICFARSFPLFQWWLLLPQLISGCRRTSSLSWRFSDLRCKLLKVINLKPWGTSSQIATHYNHLWSFKNSNAQVVPVAS